MKVKLRYLREGDIIFTAIPHFLFKRVAAGTGSKTSHVGILLKDAQGKWIVAESAVPKTQYVSLESFIRRSENHWHCVRRVKKQLTVDDIEALKWACHSRMGRWYHLGFKFHSKRQFCSKFVYEVYQEALDMEIGQLQTLQELIEEQPNTPLLFWRLWYFGFIPWSRVTITPASQMRDTRLLDVY